MPASIRSLTGEPGDNGRMARPAVQSPATRRGAAARLRHDLGKAVRFSATPAGEATSAALRRRLAADLLAARSGPDETLDAVAVFDRWWRSEGALFGPGSGSPPATAATACLARIREAVEIMRELLPRLDALADDELRELDSAARVVDAETRALRDAVAREDAGGAP